MAEHTVVARFLHVQDLAFKRQNGLEPPVPALLGSAAGRFTLDQEQLTALGIFLLAIRQLSRQTAGIERALAPCEVASFPGSFPRPRGVDTLRDDLSHHRRVLVEVLAQPLVNELNDLALNVAVQFALGLALELWLRQFHAYDGR